MRIAVSALAFVSALSLAEPALAHIELLSPTSRENEQKEGPCGREGSTRGNAVTTVRSGSVLRVTWRESVNHPSHFRISFDDDGDDDFVDPASAEDRFTNDTVLIDGISDEAGGTFSADVTLPDIECDHCTLQLIQVMYDKAPYVVGTNDLYYRCADLTLKRDAPPPSNDPPADDEPVSPGDPDADASVGATPPSHDGTSHPEGHEQDESAATADPDDPASEQVVDKEPISGQTSLCSTTALPTRSLSVVAALSLAILFVFSRRRRERNLSLVPARSKVRRRR